MSPRSAGITPAHPLIRDYLRSLKEIRAQGFKHELALRPAFQNLLADSARLNGWTFIAEPSLRINGHLVRPDGLLRDDNNFPRGYWEAKDSHDDLTREIDRKIRNDYPVQNTIFEDTRRAVLYQDREPVFEASLEDPRELSDLLFRFYSHVEPEIGRFEEAVEAFQDRIPQLAHGLAEKIAEAHSSNENFQAAFTEFFELCQRSLNPNIRQEAVDEMLIQHLLTERLFRTIFDNSEFTRRNVIAIELERVIEALVSESFSRTEYLKNLDPFYLAIESAARTISDFGEKQHFLDSVYERFFRGYSVKVADTHGIVYTPQQIVRYMCSAVEEAMKEDFGLSLSSPGVNILDPCTGTGNFIVNIIERISQRDLPRVYRDQLFANEVMLMPYYIASLNIEHAYKERTGKYLPCEGLCFVDTLDLAETPQLTFFSEKNTERVRKKREAQITVIIGNPPYNMGQLNENDNNKNRKYDVIDERIRQTYSKDSKATLKNKLSDPYVKFFRWATDRLGDREGIVCFVSNNSFIDQLAFDGMRKHLVRDFTHIDHIDLHGNVRKNPKLSGTTHNVFAIQVGVGITLAVRCKGEKRLRYHRVPEFWRKEEKLTWLKQAKPEWTILQPDPKGDWIVPEHGAAFSQFISISDIFQLNSLGVGTNRDEWVYDFDRATLAAKVQRLIKNYNHEMLRFQAENGDPKSIDDFVNNAPDFIKWTDRLKRALIAKRKLKFDPSLFRETFYRPFTKQFLYFDPLLVHRRYRQHEIFPTLAAEMENRAIWLKTGSEWPMYALMTNKIVDLMPQGGSQCFAYFLFSEDGTQRVENITDLALNVFQTHYGNVSISKWDLFYYVYAMLNHRGYRDAFAVSLKRELPRIPFARDFRAFSEGGRALAELHLNYEIIEPFRLNFEENPTERLSYKVVDKMRLSKDQTALSVNASLTLSGIPSATFEYRLGNRSALEWIIDQYHVTEDSRTRIRFDPNRKNDPEYIVRLVGQVVKISVEAVRIISSLPAQFSDDNPHR